MEHLDKNYVQLLNDVSLGYKPALDYLLIMSNVFRIWDDLYDCDKDVDREIVNKVFADLNFDLSRNSFFQVHREVLESFVFLAWNAWMDSNSWHGNPDKMKGICAWFIRDWCNELDILVAWLVGGTDHARSISLKCREFYLNQLVSRGVDGFFKG